MDQPYTVNLNHISFNLKDKHDFSWLENLGNVFSVFDQQDSGNISFGIEKDGIKTFVKYAGARTVNYDGHPAEAVANLKKSVNVYENLQHPHLVNLIDHYKTDRGYALLFEWFDGECLHPHWAFPPPEKYTHPESPFFRFKQLPVERRLEALGCIFEFHSHVEKNHFVAVDFYDGSILYDFNTHTVKICDIDLYREKPFNNHMGRLWGSSRFMSPEEFEMGAEINGRTTVYTMGAAAFALAGGERDRTYSAWDSKRSLYEVALKAVEKDNQNRFSSVQEFFAAWQEAL